MEPGDRKRGVTGLVATALLAATLGGACKEAAARDHRSFARRHPVATAVGAGLAAHHFAKSTGRHRRRHRRHRNFLQRHPVATGVATGVAAHHWAKKHR